MNSRSNLRSYLFHRVPALPSACTWKDENLVKDRSCGLICVYKTLQLSAKTYRRL